MRRRVVTLAVGAAAAVVGLTSWAWLEGREATTACQDTVTAHMAAEGREGIEWDEVDHELGDPERWVTGSFSARDGAGTESEFGFSCFVADDEVTYLNVDDLPAG